MTRPADLIMSAHSIPIFAKGPIVPIAQWVFTSPTCADHAARMTDDFLQAARRWHDMGGADAGPVLRDEHDFALWEKRVDALWIICSSKGIFTVDGLRRVLEDMGEEAFETMSYYERWIASVNHNLLEAGVYSLEELGRKIDDIRARGSSYGECVHVQGE